jgi:hypothetical protein
MDILYVNNDHLIELQGLRDSDGKLLSGAAAEATLYEADGVTEVGGQVWPLVLVYTGSLGTYRAALSAAVDLVGNGRYKLKIKASYVGKVYEVVRTVNARVRNE